MKVVALASGGKDSTFNMMLCRAYGHEVVALANLHRPDTSEGSSHATEPEEMDSFMYQTVGGSLLPALAQCAGLPLYRQPIRGQALQTGLDYAPSDTGDEVEDLTALLQRVVAADPAVRGVSVGAIASDYQRVRVESVCARLGLTPLCYLWRADQDALLSRMLDAGVEAVLCKVACMGLKPARDLGRQLADMAPTLRRLHAEFGAHICGEGGEFETFTLACPLFPRRLVLDATRARTLGEDETISPVGILEVTRWHVEDVPDEYWDGARAVEPRSPAPRRCGAEERTRHAVEATDNSAQGWRLSGESLSPAAAPAPAAVPAAVQTSSGHGWIAVTVRACTPEGLSAESPSASAQATSAAIDALAAALTTAGASLSGITLMRIYLASMDHYPAANAACRDAFEGATPPARAAVAVHLDGTGDQVRVDAVALAPAAAVPKRCLHIQSVSEWAPSMIGPYAQAAWAAGAEEDTTNGAVPLTHGSLAGSIGLHPPTMEIVGGGAGAEAAQALANVDAVMDAVGRAGRDVGAVTTYLAGDGGRLGDADAAVEVDAWVASVTQGRPKPLSIGVRVASLPMKAEVEVQVETEGVDAGRVGGGVCREGEVPRGADWGWREAEEDRLADSDCFMLRCRAVECTGGQGSSPRLAQALACLVARPGLHAAQPVLHAATLVDAVHAAASFACTSVSPGCACLLATAYYDRALGSGAEALVEAAVASAPAWAAAPPALSLIPVVGVVWPTACPLVITVCVSVGPALSENAPTGS